MNVVVVQGVLARLPEERRSSSGVRLVGFELSVARPDAKPDVVPVVWEDAPPWLLGLSPGVPVVVVGRVRRRFFRSSGVTHSRTEVVADGAAPVRQVRRVTALLSSAAGSITDGRALLP